MKEPILDNWIFSGSFIGTTHTTFNFGTIKEPEPKLL
jgi:hypothetical protein